MSKHQPTPAFDALQTSNALALLRHAGIASPQGEPNSLVWLQGLVDGLCELSSRDPLTGLVNRRSFEMVVLRELDRVARAGEPALILMVDIDHFKRINDSHGHAAGDAVLKTVSRALEDSIRPMDTVARIGGEEFAVILPNCPSAFGPTVAERVRRRVERSTTLIESGQRLVATVSIGGAFAPQWVRSSTALWLERADRQLYRSKSEGRNRVCLEATAELQVTPEEKGLLFAGTSFQELE